jgi:FixJ family two-component response regulator
MSMSHQHDKVLNRSHNSRNLSESSLPLVILVDDDARMLESLHELMLSVGIDAISFASTSDLLEAELPDRPGCLVVDVRMPGVSGLDLQHRLAESGETKPIVFLTAHGDIPMSVQAMKAGAVDFLTKPVRDQTLLDAVAAGIERDVKQRWRACTVKEHLAKFALLTPRERQVLQEVAIGRLNKQIAFALGISAVTVKLHRSNVMRKMQLASVGELIRVWETLPNDVREDCESVDRRFALLAPTKVRPQSKPHAVASTENAARALSPRRRLTRMASPQTTPVMTTQTAARPV